MLPFIFFAKGVIRVKIVKGDHVLEVTEKAFNVVYKNLDYKPFVEKKVAAKKKAVKEDGTK